MSIFHFQFFVGALPSSSSQSPLHFAAPVGTASTRSLAPPLPHKTKFCGDPSRLRGLCSPRRDMLHFRAHQRRACPLRCPSFFPQSMLCGNPESFGRSGDTDGLAAVKHFLRFTPGVSPLSRKANRLCRSPIIVNFPFSIFCGSPAPPHTEIHSYRTDTCSFSPRVETCSTSVPIKGGLVRFAVPPSSHKACRPLDLHNFSPLGNDLRHRVFLRMGYTDEQAADPGLVHYFFRRARQRDVRLARLVAQYLHFAE